LKKKISQSSASSRKLGWLPHTAPSNRVLAG